MRKSVLVRKAVLVLNEVVMVLILLCMILDLKLKNCAVLAMLIDGFATSLVLAKQKACANESCLAFFFLFVPLCYSNYFEIHFIRYLNSHFFAILKRF